MEQSLNMAISAVKSGITHLYATPHHMNERYDNPKITIIESVRMFQEQLQLYNIPLIIHLGQEVRIHRELLQSVERNDILTLDHRGKYLLLELPSNYIPTYTMDVIYELLVKEIVPILVHPERNRRLYENPSILFDLVKMGTLTQITAGSIIGHFGKNVKKFTEQIIGHHLAHFIANDAHNTQKRGFFLQNAFYTITKKFGIEQTNFFQENAHLLVRSENIKWEVPQPIRKRVLGIF